MSEKKKKYLYAREFADERNFDYFTVLRWIRQGLIKGVIKEGGEKNFSYLIPKEALATFQPPKVGRPKKDSSE